MNENTTAPGKEGIHYFQAAQRLGISVQHLMQMERSGLIDPPASLDEGRGRVYTQAELDAVAERLSAGSTVREPLSRQTWILFGVLGVLVLVIFFFRPGPAPLPRPPEDRAERAERPARERKARPVKESGEEGESGLEAEQDEAPAARVRMTLDPERAQELQDQAAANAEKIREQQAKGIYY